MERDRIVAVGLLTQRDLGLLGAAFDRLWPVEEAPHFHELLNAIDRADEALRRDRPVKSRAERQSSRRPLPSRSRS